MQQLSDFFSVRYGHSLELNRLTQCSSQDGIAFVSRKMGDNGVAAYVLPLPDIEPAPAGELTCALSGNGVLSTFIQERPFYTAFHVARLAPLVPMSKAELLYYCMCIKANRYRYSYGRQANRTLSSIVVPSLEEIPHWVNGTPLPDVQHLPQPVRVAEDVTLDTEHWRWFKFSDLFELKKGKRLTKQHMIPGATPFIGSSDANNGLTATIGQAPIHAGNTISVCYNGSVAEAFYQPHPFWATDDVNVLYPKFPLNPYRALFLTTLIRREKYRYNYGRKWHLGRMQESLLKLPTIPEGTPDWTWMDAYIQSLPYSSAIPQMSDQARVLA